MRLRFHWRLLQGGPTPGMDTQRVAADAALPQLDAQAAFCRDAEASGIESVLVDLNAGKPDPLTLALALARTTQRLRFLVAVRPGMTAPTLFVQQVNTFAALSGGRITLNVVAGHSPHEQRGYGDHLDHDERYARMGEWLTVCHALWERAEPVHFAGRYYHIEGGRLNTPFVAPDRCRPEIYLGGSSEQARQVALHLADCWVRFGASPAAIREETAAFRTSGTSIGLRLSVVCRSSRSEALRSARRLLETEAARVRARAEKTFVAGSDAVSMRQAYDLGANEWPTPWLWAGAVRVLGAPALCLLGTPDDVACGLLAFREAGVTQFILSGWPTQEEMLRFGREVLPLVRRGEDEPADATPSLSTAKEGYPHGP